MTVKTTLPAAAEIQALLDQSQPRGDFRVLSATHEKAFPKKDRIDLYRVELSCAGVRRNTTLAVHRLAPERREKALAKLAKAAERLTRVDADALAIHGEAPEAGALIYSFPLDIKLARLAEAVSPKHVAEKLGITCDVDVEIARYVPARRCQLRWTTEHTSLYTKLYQDDRGEAVFRAMQWLHGHMNAGSPAGISTPAPVAYWQDWHALSQEAAPGVTLLSLYSSGQVDSDAFALAGTALAAMHNADGSGIAVTRKHSSLDEVHVAGEWAYLATQQQPSFRELCGRLAQLAPWADHEVSSATAVHRDCYDRQFLIDGANATIIDLDEISLGEPELDLANFLAHVELRAIQGLIAPESADRFGDAFVAAYRADCRHALDTRRLQFYLATSLIRLAALYSMRPGEEASSDRLLVRAVEAVGDFL